MGIEIERKFLVRGEFKDPDSKKEYILQKYLSVDPERTIRIRISGENAFITIKSNTLLEKATRAEWEYKIPMDEASEIMKICLPGKVEKTRYYIPYASHTFEVDVFHKKNEGLILAEIELSSESESFEKPGWLGEEVTGNPDYFNVNLLK
jgi:adenylate cyclase